MKGVDRRIGLVFAAFIALLSIAVLRATYLGVVRAGSLRHAAATQQVRTVRIPAERGSIADRHGIELAISESADDLAADPYQIKDPVGTAQKLAPLLGKPVSALLPLLTRKHTGFVYLAHLVPADRIAQINRLHLDGLSTTPQIRRVYPRPWTASQVLGAVGWGDDGLRGLEYRYNGVLRGEDGERRIVYDALGQPISIDDLRPTKAGKPLRLTIDAPLQEQVEQVLRDVGAQWQPMGATAIAMDPNTGAILALANWPQINANNDAQRASYFNQDRAVGFIYEPGSTFKAITVAAALQDGIVNPDTPFDIPPVLQVADRQIHDAESHGDETLKVSDILRVSSNIGAVKIGQLLGERRFNYWVRRFGFGSPTGVDLPGEERGLVLHLNQYSGSSMGNLPIGQGESVTPIQMAAAYAAIANGGILRPPHIVAAIGNHPVPTPAGHRIISSPTATELRTMLKGVFDDGGTASGAAIPGYCLSGKTGTANEVYHGEYSSTRYAASFIGFVPADHPRLLVAVLVDQPHGAISGGSVAAPAFQKIVSWAVPYLGIPPC